MHIVITIILRIYYSKEKIWKKETIHIQKMKTRFLINNKNLIQKIKTRFLFNHKDKILKINNNFNKINRNKSKLI